MHIIFFENSLRQIIDGPPALSSDCLKQIDVYHSRAGTEKPLKTDNCQTLFIVCHVRYLYSINLIFFVAVPNTDPNEELVLKQALETAWIKPI